MLVLSRRVNEAIVIDGGITITVLKTGNQIKFGIVAPQTVDIQRAELLCPKAIGVRGGQNNGH